MKEIIEPCKRLILLAFIGLSTHWRGAGAAEQARLEIELSY